VHYIISYTYRYNIVNRFSFRPCITPTVTSRMIVFTGKEGGKDAPHKDLARCLIIYILLLLQIILYALLELYIVPFSSVRLSREACWQLGRSAGPVTGPTQDSDKPIIIDYYIVKNQHRWRLASRNVYTTLTQLRDVWQRKLLYYIWTFGTFRSVLLPALQYEAMFTRIRVYTKRENIKSEVIEGKSWITISWLYLRFATRILIRKRLYALPWRSRFLNNWVKNEFYWSLFTFTANKRFVWKRKSNTSFIVSF